MNLKKLLLIILYSVLISCNTQYKQVVQSISNLPVNKLLNRSNSQSEPTSKIDSVLRFSVTSKERFDFVINLDSILKKRFTDYKRSRSKDNFEKVVSALNKISIEKNISVDVQFKTKFPNAYVIYRTQANIKKTTSNNPTTCTIKSLNIGEYYFWTERNGIVTSDTTKTYFIGNRDTITLEENEKIIKKIRK